MKTKLLFKSLFLCLLLHNILLSQNEKLDCLFSPNNRPVKLSKNSNAKLTSDTLHVMAIFSVPNNAASDYFSDMDQVSQIEDYYRRISFSKCFLKIHVISNGPNQCFRSDYNVVDTTGVFTYQYIRNILEKVDSLYNFDLYDFDGDKHVDAIFFNVTNVPGFYGIRGTAWSFIDYTTRDSSRYGGLVDIDREITKTTKVKFYQTRDVYNGNIHEFGHVLGLLDMCPTSSDHYGVGMFDAMSIGSFDGVASPFNPFFRELLGWATPTTISSTQLSQPISDFCGTGQSFKYQPASIPSYAVGDTRWYISYHKAAADSWEQNWPVNPTTGGILIWRVIDPSGYQLSYAPRNIRPVVLEQASGKYRWNGLTRGEANSNIGFDSLQILGSYQYSSNIGSNGCLFLPGTGKEFGFSTNPNSNFQYSNDVSYPHSVTSGFAVKNFTYSGGTATLDLKVNDYTVTSNCRLDTGTWYITNDITVASGVTLTIESGTILKFASGKKMYVFGTLNATGTAAERITFTTINPTEYWGGIVFNGSGAGGSTLSYCDISRVTTYGGSAISFINVSGNPTVQYCNITNNTGNSTTGLAFDNSNGYLLKNLIGNNDNGVVCLSGASPTFGKANFYFSCGGESNNKIINNTNTGVYSSGSYPFIGSINNSIVRGNSIFDNTSVNINAVSQSQILAEFVWWGSNPPNTSKIISSGNSTIEYTPYCDYPPSSKMNGTKEEYIDIPMLSKAVKERSNPVIANSSDGSDSQFDEAMLYIMKEEYENANNIFKSIITSSKDEAVITRAIYGLLSSFRASNDKNVISYLESLLAKRIDLKSVISFVLGNAYLVSDKTEEAKILYQKIIKESSDNALTKSAKVKLAVLYHFNKKDDEKANIILYDLMNAKDYSSIDTEIGLANWLINGISFQKEGSKEQGNSITGSSSFSTGIIGNYPNPFNPSTVIKYKLGEDLRVSIKVYDIVGREIKVLKDEYQNKGNHEVLFDAKDISSGVYFCCFRAGEVKQITKLLFAK